MKPVEEYIATHISTHALTEGDTLPFFCGIFVSISTHALTEGDHEEYSPYETNVYFNSRPHGGRQRGATETSNAESFQLTPSRRATFYSFFRSFGYIFQLTPSRRATIPKNACSISIKFQLTPSRRATTVPEQKISHYDSFQLTPSRRATAQDQMLWVRKIFQLTPSRRATKNPCQ